MPRYKPVVFGPDHDRHFIMPLSDHEFQIWREGDIPTNYVCELEPEVESLIVNPEALTSFEFVAYVREQIGNYCGDGYWKWRYDCLPDKSLAYVKAHMEEMGIAAKAIDITSMV